MKLICNLYYPNASAKTIADHQKRDLVCTPFGGHAGMRAGWIICVDGSPPKGTVVFFDREPEAFYLRANGDCKNLPASQLRLVMEFFAKHLSNQIGPLKLHSS